MVFIVLLYFWFACEALGSLPMKMLEKIARYTMVAGSDSAYWHTVLTR